MNQNNNQWRGHALLRGRWALALTAALYCLLEVASGGFTDTPGQAPLLSPALGIGLALILHPGARLWTAIWTGSIAATLWIGYPLAAGVVVAASTTLGLLTGRIAFRRLYGGGNPLTDARGVLLLTLCGMLATATIAAAGRAAASALWLGSEAYGAGFAAHWLAASASILALAPPALALFQVRETRLDFASRLETLLVLAFAVVCAHYAFFGGPGNADGYYPLAFLVLPGLAWAVARLNPLAATLATTAVASVAVLGTGLGRGPFGQLPEFLSPPLLQIYLIVACASAYSALGLKLERWRAQASLREASDALEQRVELRTRELLGAKRRLEREIAEQKSSREQIYRLAHYDPVTDLPNRRLCQEYLARALSQLQHSRAMVAVLIVDLDHFKLVNDSLGHGSGDLLLRQAAHRLQQTVREADVVARWGGDEFALVLTDLSHSRQAAAVAQNILDALIAPFQLDGQETVISASIGVSLAPDDGADHQILLSNADTAMARAKIEGRNGIQFFTEEMNASLRERLALESQLRSALARDEFVLHYQPQVSLANGRITAVEALLRWQHPELGLVPPGRFIPLAEETGLIVPIGRWVMETACRQHADWLALGFGQIRMAVNISGRSFQDSHLVEDVATTLQRTGIQARFLELELTETYLVHDPECAVQILDQLKALGTPITIDDFGTGYSSLSYLKRFALDRLKIDQSFVRDLPDDADDAAITATIIDMAKNLGLRVTAEGVETLEQLDFLRRHGCDEIQGFYFSPPLSAADCTTLLEHQRLALAAAE